MFHEPLTPREEEVIALIADGMSTRDMAAQRFVSIHTIRSQVASIMAKLGTHSRLESVALWRKLQVEKAVDDEGVTLRLTHEQAHVLRSVFG